MRELACVFYMDYLVSKTEFVCCQRYVDYFNCSMKMEINRVLIIPALKESLGSFICWSASQEAILGFLRVCVLRLDPTIMSSWLWPSHQRRAGDGRAGGTTCRCWRVLRKESEQGAEDRRAKAASYSIWHEFSH